MRLGGRMINPGELRTQVSVKNPTVTKDAGGAQSVARITAAILYVRWKNEHGPEAVSSDARKAVKRATVLSRYCSEVSELSALEKNGELWQVISVDDIEERHEYMELIVEQAKATV